ncbi:MAG: hypothetical protein ACTSQJ_16870, partial [Promethearchaeota archaeon]
MKDKNIKYISAIGLITIFLIANWVEITSNSTYSYSAPDIKYFRVNNDKPDVNERIKFKWDIDWKNNPKKFWRLFINFGNGSGMINITKRIEKKFVYHKYFAEGKYHVSLWAFANLSNSSTANLTINVVNRPTDFDISLTTSIEVNNATYNFESDTPAPRSKLRGYNPKYDPKGWTDLKHYNLL